MTRTKIIFSIMLATILLATQFIAVGAAPATQEATPITGTIEGITLETDTETNVTTVLVTLTNGETQTVRLSLEDAIALGLVTDDGTGPVVDDTKIGTTVEINPTIVIPDEPDEMQHPVGSRLSDFFSEILGVDYETIMGYHEEGVGFGVIAQALWITNALKETGDTELTPEELAVIFGNILDAKKNKNFDELGITLPDGSTPQNWGQFRKAIMSDRDKSKENLGAIMSGRAEDDQVDQVPTQSQYNSQGSDKSKDKSNNGKSEDKGNNGKDKNKDKGKDKGKSKNK